MNMLYFFLFAMVHSEQIIKNINVPSCRNCVHFKPYYSTEFANSLSKCSKFGTKDIITDKISYNEYADMTRKDETKCGKEGKYFEQEQNLQLKILIHQFVSGLPNILLTTTFVFYMITLIKIRQN